MRSTPPGEETLSYRGVHLDGCHLLGQAPLAVEMVVSGTLEEAGGYWWFQLPVALHPCLLQD